MVRQLTPIQYNEKIINPDGTATPKLLLHLQLQRNATGDSLPIRGGQTTGPIRVPYHAWGLDWAESLEVPTKRAIYERILSSSAGSYIVEDILDIGTLQSGDNVRDPLNTALQAIRDYYTTGRVSTLGRGTDSLGNVVSRNLRGAGFVLKFRRSGQQFAVSGGGINATAVANSTAPAGAFRNPAGATIDFTGNALIGENLQTDDILFDCSGSRYMKLLFPALGNKHDSPCLALLLNARTALSVGGGNLASASHFYMLRPYFEGETVLAHWVHLSSEECIVEGGGTIFQHGSFANSQCILNDVSNVDGVQSKFQTIQPQNDVESNVHLQAPRMTVRHFGGQGRAAVTLRGTKGADFSGGYLTARHCEEIIHLDCSAAQTRSIKFAHMHFEKEDDTDYVSGAIERPAVAVKIVSDPAQPANALVMGIYLEEVSGDAADVYPTDAFVDLTGFSGTLIDATLINNFVKPVFKGGGNTTLRQGLIIDRSNGLNAGIPLNVHQLGRTIDTRVRTSNAANGPVKTDFVAGSDSQYVLEHSRGTLHVGSPATYQIAANGSVTGSALLSNSMRINTATGVPLQAIILPNTPLGTRIECIAVSDVPVVHNAAGVFSNWYILSATNQDMIIPAGRSFFITVDRIGTSGAFFLRMGEAPILLPGDPVVQIPTLNAPWINYGSGFLGARYFKTYENVVVIEGLIQAAGGSSTSGVTLFTLLPGFRPSGTLVFTTANGGGSGRIDVTANGDVIMQSGNTAFTSLSNITFAAQ